MIRTNTASKKSILGTFMTASIFMFSLNIVGCEGKKKVEPPVAPVEAASSSSQAEQAIDAELLNELKDAASDCKALQGNARINCSGPKKNALVLSFNRGKRKKIAALPTFTAALGDEDQNLQALAASVLYASYRLGLDKDAKVGAVSRDEAKAFFTASFALPSAISMQAIPAATHALLLSDQKEVLLKALVDAKSMQVRTMAYRYMMVYGRLSVFESIKTLGEEKPSTMVLAAIESPRNMKNWSRDEQEAICPWAAGFISDARQPVATNALAVLSNCTGKHIDLLMDEIEESLKKKEFSFIHSTALRDACSVRDQKREIGASEEQCQRGRKLLEKAVVSKDVSGRVRAMALSSMAYRWADAQSFQFAKKLEKNKVPEVKRAAQQVVQRLTSKLADGAKTNATKPSAKRSSKVAKKTPSPLPQPAPRSVKPPAVQPTSANTSNP